MDRKRLSLTLLIVVHILCVILFISGFLSVSFPDRDFQVPLSSNFGNSNRLVIFSDTGNPSDAKDKFSLQSDLSYLKNSSTLQEPQVLKKLVVFLIDALRADFVFGKHPVLKFAVEQMYSGRGKGFLAKAQTPTVTMPRLKALTTGSIPNFADVIFNFGAQASVKDNILTRFNRAGLKTAFYGDDTWLKMFPDGFDRAEGVSSFYVNDYKEVDENVTRNVMLELQRDDWDVLILHYLGLDHIGHLAGPRSSLVLPKLTEMSAVIKEIYGVLSAKSEDFLLVVLGDHGMTDSGNHGGSSQLEIETPMVFLSPKFLSKAHDTDHGPQIVNQIDLAPTLALLMGVPIPGENIGFYILPVLRTFLSDKQLGLATSIMAMHLLNQLQTKETGLLSSHLWNIRTKFSDNNTLPSATEVEAAVQVFARASEYLASKGATYNLPIMLFALASGAICIAIHVKIFWGCRLVPRNWTSGLICGFVVFHAASFLSSSFVEEEHQLWYFWLPTAGIVFLFGRVDIKKTGTWGIIVAIFLLQRLLREWNRTGDKWAHLPDIGDWLQEPDNWVSLCLVIVLSSYGQSLLRLPSSRFMMTPLLLCTAFFQILHWNWLSWVVYVAGIFGIVMLIVDPSGRRSRHLRLNSLRDILILWANLLVRPHNVPLIFLIQCLERTMELAVRLWEIRSRNFWLMIFYFIHGWSSFYQLGNSNALSSIDVSAGFAGISFYFAPLHGLLMFLHVYIGPLFWFLSLVGLSEPRFCSDQREGLELVNVILIARLVMLLAAFTSATLQRHHLFVWTVFAPKVLYESSHSLWTCLLALPVVLVWRN